MRTRLRLRTTRLLVTWIAVITLIAASMAAPRAAIGRAAVGRAAAGLDRGAIVGKVVDHNGSVIPGAPVTIAGPERRTAVTDDKGEFAFRLLLPGVYAVRVALEGFRVETATVTVASGQTVTLSVKLEIGSLSETVTVQAGPPTISTSTSAASAQFLHGRPHGFERNVGPFNTEAYDHRDDNAFRRVSATPLSTFSIDVDTASYANVRRFLNDGSLPPPGAVRIEELVNYFRFDYPQPSGDAPFSVTTELAPCPWNAKHALALIGLRGRELLETAAPGSTRPAHNLVFLIDVSGSMMPPNKLPLVKQSLRMLTERLDARDRVAIVVYAGSSGLVLPSTTGDRKTAIHDAIENLESGGSTNGAAGITLAYGVAREHFVTGGVNRVILATDGDFNVGVTSQDALVRLIEEQRASGVFLSVLGVGTGNLKDATMERLADRGNGNYAYIDSLQEARKVLVREAGGTLVTIAQDVKIQVEFNPRTVSAYRLIGYENRLLEDEDFNDDKNDAGEIGAGHTVTAVYEIVPASPRLLSGHGGGQAGAAGDAAPAPAIASVDPLKYQRPRTQSAAADAHEIATVKLRYKAPGGETSRLTSTVIDGVVRPLGANLGFASAVVEFGMLLRRSRHAGTASFESLLARARAFRGADPDGDRAGFVALAELAAEVSRTEQGKKRARPSTVSDDQRR